MSSPWPASCRFFFHRRIGANLIEDWIGEYHADVADAYLRARIIARELLDRGPQHPSCVIVIMDDYGHVLDAVPVADPVEMPAAPIGDAAVAAAAA